MTIVAAVDRTDRATRVIKEAEALADAFGEDVHVLHVISESEFVDIEQASVEDTGQTVSVDRIKAAAKQQAEKAVDQVEADHSAIGLVGKVDQKIIDYAEEQDASYIVLAPRKKSPTGKALFGSVAQGVILNAERPVVSITVDR